MRLAGGWLRHVGATVVHKWWVAYYLLRFVLFHCKPGDAAELTRRAVVHDLSKFRWDEAKHFAKVIPLLRGTTYGSGRYRALLGRIRPALDLHYARNSHHPEFHDLGFTEMERLDRIEMVADWAAAVRRHADGNLGRSIEQNKERFGYDEQEAWHLRRLARQMGAL